MIINSALSGLHMECNNGVVKIVHEARCGKFAYRPNIGKFIINIIGGHDTEVFRVTEIDCNINELILGGFRNSVRSTITEIYALFLCQCGFDKLFTRYDVVNGEIVNFHQPPASIDQIFNQLMDQRAETILVSDTKPSRVVIDFREILRQFIDETVTEAQRVLVTKSDLAESEEKNNEDG